VVDGGWGDEPDPGVAMGVVVPVKESAAVRAGLLDRVELDWEPGAVLQCLEVRLAVGLDLAVRRKTSD
jgi:hypothetical protein